MEHIMDKRARAHRQLYNASELFENVIDSLTLADSKPLYPKILDYTFRAQHVIAKYCSVYFQYNVNLVENNVTEADGEEAMKNKITVVCKLLSALCKFIKVRVSVIIKDDPQALDLIHNIFGHKINFRVQEYLVSIDYWYHTLPDDMKKKYHL